MLNRLGLTTLLLFTLVSSGQADTNNGLGPDLVVRIELDKTSLRVGDPVSGRVVFSNNSPLKIDLFYPGFRTSNSLSTFAAQVDGLLPNGKPRIVCQRRVDEAETHCETKIVKPGELIGATSKGHILESPVEPEPLAEQLSRKVTIQPGKEVKVDFRLDSCKELIPTFFECDEEGKVLSETPAYYLGTYELVFKYESKRVAFEKSWLGKVQTLPIRFDVLPAK